MENKTVEQSDLCLICNRAVDQHDMGTGFATCRGIAVPTFRSRLASQAPLLARIETLEAALESSEAAMTTVVEGDPMGVRGPKVCQHGRFSWEGCENCIDDVLSPALDAALNALGRKG